MGLPGSSGRARPSRSVPTGSRYGRVMDVVFLHCGQKHHKDLADVRASWLSLCQSSRADQALRNDRHIGESCPD